MSLSLLLKALAAWLVMLIISIINGSVRDFGYGKRMSELHAHQLSTVISILLLGLVMWLFTSRYSPSSIKAALLLGSLWSGLTLAFEFLFFHYVGKHSWAELLANYDVLHGRVWVFVVVWLFIAPYLFLIIRKQP
jgi:hypothetical protein